MKLTAHGRCALQFGHGCDAVEIQDRVEHQVGVEKLQFGHGCDAVEITYGERYVHERTAASIRPRL